MSLKLLESQVRQQIRDFMLHRGWRPVRTQFAFAPGAFTTGEPGMADELFLRYDVKAGHCLAVWVEYKSPNDKRKCTCTIGKQCKQCRQKDWRDKERFRGAIVWMTSSFEAFEQAYEKQFGWLHRDPDRAVGQLRMEGI